MMPARARRVLRLVPILSFVLIIVFVFAIFADGALARPGGGQSYSGGSRSSGSRSSGGSSGGDGGAIFEIIVWLLLSHPSIGIPVLIAVVVFLAFRSRASKKEEWSTAAPAPAASRTPERARGMPMTPSPQRDAESRTGVSRTSLDAIRAIDPEFSVALFEDFVYLLYAEIQRARAGNPARLAPLAPFLAPQLAQSLQADPQRANLAEIRGIVIGAMRVTGFSGTGSAMVSVELEFEVNYAEVDRQGRERRFYVTDRMSLSRARTAVSRPAGRAQTLDCPNCGAPLQSMRGTQCGHCQQDVGGGRFDWVTGYVTTLQKEPRGPLLTGDVEEVGTSDPTLIDPQAIPRIRALEQRDPSFHWDAFTNRVGHVYRELTVAWSGREPARIRPYVSDNLFQSMVYWIDLYLNTKCRNMNDNARIVRVDLANVLSDKVYDAITVRVFATGLDYTISDDGKVLSGNRKRERNYTEYWTFLRGSQRKGAAKADTNCPNCGAPLNISMVGNCQYCSAKVTAGEFDWVLSRIEQDESYTG